MKFCEELGYPFVRLPNSYLDDRGEILNLFTAGMKSGALITSVKGSVRANHYHKKGGHLCYVVSGELIYKYRPVGSDETPKSVIVGTGEAFYTGPMLEHAMEFVQDSVFLSFDPEVERNHDGYENDLIRLEKPL